MRKKIILLCMIFLIQKVAFSQCFANYLYTVSNDTVYFYNASSISNSHYYWNFGHGDGSNQVNPIHVFPESGNYLVTLYVLDTLSGCSDYFETRIDIVHPSSLPCVPFYRDSAFTYLGDDFVWIDEEAPSCSYLYNNVDFGPAQNFPPGNSVIMTGSQNSLFFGRAQYYTNDSINGFVLQREYYKTHPYYFSSAVNYDFCSANFEVIIDYQLTGAMVWLTPMNKNALSYDWAVVGFGSPIHYNTENASHFYPYVSYEKFFPWNIYLTIYEAGGCNSTSCQTILVENKNYVTPPNCSISTQPQNTFAYVGDGVQFYISSMSGTTKQWQQDAGLGWVNLTNAGPFSGVNTDTLTILNVQPTMNNYHYRCKVSENFSGCSNTSNEVVLTIAVGINEESINVFSFYPNPAETEINIKLNENFKSAEYIIHNTIGDEILSGTISQQDKINVEILSDGLYILELMLDNITVRQKFIKR